MDPLCPPLDATQVYAKLLVQKARKKLANEVRACSVENEAFGMTTDCLPHQVRARSEENEAFGKSQAEKYLGETHKKAEAIAAGKAEMKLAIEGLRVHNLELAKELKINLSQLQVSALRVPSEYPLSALRVPSECLLSAL